MRLFAADDGTVRFAIARRRRRGQRGARSYAVWFTKPGGPPRRLGFAKTPGGQGRRAHDRRAANEDEDRSRAWFATYDKVLITRERPSRSKPGPADARGILPRAAG